jgi:hypothetical protein
LDGPGSHSEKSPGIEMPREILRLAQRSLRMTT